MTVPAAALSLAASPPPRASADELFELVSGEDFGRWEAQLEATGNCANPVRLTGRIDAIDRATGEIATIYDTTNEPGAVLRIPCGNRREDICPPCSEVYKGDARQIIRAGLTGGKGIPESVAAHPCVFATLTAPGFGPVHTIRTGRAGRKFACCPRRDAHQRRCPHGRDISCPRRHHENDPQLGTPMCPECYDYTGHVLFNALAPELWRRFTIYLPRQLARLVGITQDQLRTEVRVRFVKVAEYQHRGIIHYHAVIRLDAPGDSYQPPPPRYTAQLLEQAIRATVAAVGYDTTAVTADDPSLRRILRFGIQTDIRPIRQAESLLGTGKALSPQAVANYIAKYATKTTSVPGLPGWAVGSPAEITALACNQHFKQLISTTWDLGKDPAAAPLALNRWTHTLGYRGHFLTKSRHYSVTFTALRRARIDYRRTQRHPGGELDPWGRRLDDRIVLTVSTWDYAGNGHASTAERELALAAAARARERHRIAREETWTN
jgi:Replication initiator protein, pSAM2